jgi:hypothetical protein
MVGKTAPYISKIRRSMLQKLFNIDGKPLDFDEQVLNIC